MPANDLYGQANQAENDSTFKVYMSEALDEISEQEGAPGADSLQNHYAQQFFQYHIKDPSSKTGWRAGWLAFMLWWHTGSAEQMDEAMARLGYDSELWSRIMGYIKSGYDRSEQKSRNDYLKLLHRLKEKLTHPVSRSAVLFHLGDYYMSKDRLTKAEALYREA